MVLPPIKPTRLTCSRCGLQIGRFVMIEDEEVIQIGGLVVAEIDGNCAQCGQAFHYSLNARRLERLIRRVERIPRPITTKPSKSEKY